MKPHFTGTRAMSLTTLLLLTAAGSAFGASAEPSSVEPYIDEIRSNLGEPPAGKPVGVPIGDPEPYIQFLREKKSLSVDEGETEGQSYIEELQQANPGLHPNATGGVESFINEERAKLPVGEPSGGAIEAVKQGRSALKARMRGDITGASGLKIGTGLDHQITTTGTSASRNFQAVFGNKFVPDVTVFYERQPFHSEIWGNVGIVGSLGLAYHTGKGTFAVRLPKPGTNNTEFYATESRTKIQFFQLPAQVGLNYRFNLGRYVRPWAQAGAGVVTLVEQRNDGVSKKIAFAGTYQLSGGAALLLDWISAPSAWNLYTEYGIQHTYLTVEYSQTNPLWGDIRVSVSGLSAGLAFEF